jgi:hypothetical protein
MSLCLSDEDKVSELCLDLDSGEKALDEEPAIWNMYIFSLVKREIFRIANRWRYVESGNVLLDRHKDLQDPLFR